MLTEACPFFFYSKLLAMGCLLFQGLSDSVHCVGWGMGICNKVLSQSRWNTMVEHPWSLRKQGSCKSTLTLKPGCFHWNRFTAYPISCHTQQQFSSLQFRIILVACHATGKLAQAGCQTLVGVEFWCSKFTFVRVNFLFSDFWWWGFGP